ncbi:MAG: segregation/condensation protein A [Planctomycetota bacterium]|nr:segregation/condensation protein A [Planctomycetota bacterium]
MQIDEYKVRLDAFEGPLDLLLFLIKRDEVDIHDIPIARVAEQYLSFLTALRETSPARLDIDVAGEFLVMAATLMEIKSRVLAKDRPGQAPAGPGDAPPPSQDDPRADLVRQLIEYKRFRDAGDALERRGEEWRRRAGITGVDVPDESLRAALAQAEDLDLDDLSIMDLADAFARIAESVNFERLGDHEVTYDDTPIEVHAEEILARVTAPDAGDAPAGRPGVALASLFEGRTRGEMIGLFLALLELVRTRRAGVRQDEHSGIVVFRREPEPPADASSAVGADAPAGA